MPHPLRGGLTFTPTLEEFAAERVDSSVTVLSGSNNSGKSLVLKWLKQTMGKTAYMIGTNRFYHVYHFSTGIRNPNELDQFESQFSSNLWSEEYNYEQNYIDLNRIIVGLSDHQRVSLFELCGRLIGASFSLERVQPDNELSMRYIDVDGQNLSVASTGTRLLMTILGICMDDRFETLLIDEPELGLSPRVQNELAAFLQDPSERLNFFPHLKQVILATHSHLFLHRNDLTSNYAASKDGSHITLSRVQTISDFHRLQFNLLGNSLEGLFLPSSIVFVEGETDQLYLERVLTLRFPARNVVVVQSGGNPKRKLYSLKETLGDLQKSPLRDRLFVVVDSVHAGGLKAELVEMGLRPENFIAWSRNGIEYFYRDQILKEIFGDADPSCLAINDDVVSLNGIEMRKKTLCQKVIRRVDRITVLPSELEDRLLTKVSAAIG
jgi:predicted ATP-dependent endonuclease of OLD family